MRTEPELSSPTNGKVITRTIRVVKRTIIPKALASNVEIVEPAKVEVKTEPESRAVDTKTKRSKIVISFNNRINLACIAISLAYFLLLLLAPIVCFEENDMRVGGYSNGIDIIKSLLKILGSDVKSYYYNLKIASALSAGTFGKDIFGTIITLIPMILTIFMMVFALASAVVYTCKLVMNENPRDVNYYAITNIAFLILTTSALVVMSNAETKVVERLQNTSDFFAFRSSIYAGQGLVLSYLLSAVLIVLPYCVPADAKGRNNR